MFFTVQSLQKQIGTLQMINNCILNFLELEKKRDVEHLIKLNKKKSRTPVLSNVIVKEFFSMLETEKTTELTKIQQQLERIKKIKNMFDFETKSTILGSKRKT